MKRHIEVVLPVLLVLLVVGQAYAQGSPQLTTDQLREQERLLNTMRQGVRAYWVQQPRGGGQLSIGRDPLNNTTLGGAWWTNTALVERLGLTEEQKTKIERAFENHRQSIVSTTAALEKEESQLAKLLEAEPIDRIAVQGQIDRVIQARGEMERANAAMTLEMREYLTRAQWLQLPRVGVSFSVTTPGGAGGRGQRTGGPPPTTTTPQPGGRRGPGGQQ